MKQGACHGWAIQHVGVRGEDDIFFPSTKSNESAAVAGFCFSCKVVDECKAYRKEIGATAGVWGGEKYRDTKER